MSWREFPDLTLHEPQEGSTALDSFILEEMTECHSILSVVIFGTFTPSRGEDNTTLMILHGIVLVLAVREVEVELIAGIAEERVWLSFCEDDLGPRFSLKAVYDGLGPFFLS